MKKIFYILFLFSITACAQKSNNGNNVQTNVDTLINLSIDNSITSEHINIPGTRLYLILQNNFDLASSFIGLQKGDNGAMIVYDLVEVVIIQMQGHFRKKNLSDKGQEYMILKKFQ